MHAQKLYIDLNGVRQGMFITGADRGRPVLLYLHGGLPEFFLERKHPSGLDQLFTVVWWEQRGSGLSYRPGDADTPVTVEQLIRDTLTLTDYLRHRFDQDRIYLLGHSGGTFIGIQAAARAPERYHAYIGVAQISHQLESEARAHRYMLKECRRRGLSRLARRLERSPVTEAGGISDGYMRVRDRAMHRLGVGTMRSIRSVVSGIVLPSLRCPDYTPMEKVRLWVAKARSGTSVAWDEILATDLRDRVTAIGTPVYLLHGVHDYTCSYPLARDYAHRLTAPIKGFYSFHESAHSPVFEEPERVRDIMARDVLNGTASLADPGGATPVQERPEQHH